MSYAWHILGIYTPTGPISLLCGRYIPTTIFLVWYTTSMTHCHISEIYHTNICQMTICVIWQVYIWLLWIRVYAWHRALCIIWHGYQIYTMHINNFGDHDSRCSLTTRIQSFAGDTSVDTRALPSPVQGPGNTPVSKKCRSLYRFYHF